jgi:type II secretory pathway pseudopilin PulG
MVELIMTIVIMGILSAGAYVSLAKLYAKSARTKAISDLSLQSSVIANQITGLLKERIPATVIGYDSTNNTFESIYTISQKYQILEWISSDFDGYRSGMYSGFLDLDKCDPTTLKLHSPATDINATDRALLFSGAFDEGDLIYDQGDFNASFGWHGNRADKIYPLDPANSATTTLALTKKPDVIYEKYTLARTAYAVARYPDIDTTAACIQNLDLGKNIGTDTLFLFYDYQPWSGETFCADPNGSGQSGSVTVLSNDAAGFEVDFIDNSLMFTLTLERTIRKPGKDLNVTISKQKVVY